MGSLTTCIRKAGNALTDEDRRAILDRAAALRREGLSPSEAAQRAVDERLADLQGVLETPSPVAATPEPVQTVPESIAAMLRLIGKRDEEIGAMTPAERDAAIRAAENATATGARQEDTDPRRQAVAAEMEHRIRRLRADFKMRVVRLRRSDFGLRQARAVARDLFGHDVAFVEQTPNVFSGAVIDMPELTTILLNVASKMPAMAVTGHELLHRLRAMRPDLYDALYARISQMLRDESAYADALRAKYAKQGFPISADAIHEELIADIVGDQFMSARFWREFRREDSTLIRRVLDAILVFIDDLIVNTSRLNPFGTHKYLTDLRAAREAVASAMREFSVSEMALQREAAEMRAKPAGGLPLFSVAETSPDQPQQPATLQPPSMRVPRSIGGIAPAALDVVNTVIETPIRWATQAAHADKLASWGLHTALEAADRALSVFGSAYEHVKAGVVDRYGLSDEYSEAKQSMKTAIRQNARRTGEIIERLRSLDRQQSRVAYLWMSDKTADSAAERALFDSLPEQARETLEQLKRDIDNVSRDAIRLGLLSEESYQRNRFAYLHRSYDKYEEEQNSEPIVRANAVRVLGDSFKGRGMRDDVTMSAIEATDWWQRRTERGRADVSLKGQKFIRLEKRDPMPDVTTAPLIEGGKKVPRGRLREVVYWPADEPLPARFADWINDGLWEARFFDRNGKVGMWRDFTLAERTHLGEIQEVKYAIAKTMMQMVRDVETARFLDWVARNESKMTAEQLPAGAEIAPAARRSGQYKANEWVEVPKTEIKDTGGVKQYGHLAGRFVPGMVWSDLKQINELRDQGDLSRAWATMMRLWKISKTALSPVTHMNNVMANFVMADMHDVQARHMATAIRAWVTYKRDPEMRKLIEAYQDNGGDAGMFNQAEINEEIFGPLIEELDLEVKRQTSTALVSAAQVLDLVQHRQFRQAFAALGKTQTARAVSWVPRKMIKLYGREDEVFRLAAFIKAREDGLNEHDAGKFARDSFLNYEISAPWINGLRRSVMPFIAFTYRALPMLVKTMATKPHKFIKYWIVAEALNAFAYMMLGGDDDQEERERALLPDELNGKAWGIFPKLMRAPWNDEYGSPVFVDVRRWIPVGDVVDFGQSHSAVPLPPPLMPGGPAVLLAEFFLNTSGFTGRDITERTDTLAQRFEKSAAHLWKGVMPNFPGLPGTWSTQALMQADRGKTDDFGREQSLAQAALSAVGIKVRSYPPDVLEHNLQVKAMADIANIQSILRGKARELDRRGITQAEYDEAERDALQKLEQIERELTRKIGRAGR